jgi:lysozyme family protein/peptidoglycan hydrolase-like protein with peptidoglycan-binding domain
MAHLEALFQKFKAGYESNWQKMQIRPERAAQANKEASELLRNKSLYQEIEALTRVPWPFIGLCHDRESGFKPHTYLGNGQSLGRVTTIVPKGRGPFLGPNAFVDGAVDALRIQGFVGATDWSLARTLFRLEAFNGFGYHSRGVHSPYVWSGSTIYGPPEERAGKFVADGVFDANVVDPQLGVAVVLKELMALDGSISFGDPSSAPIGSTEPDVALGSDVLHVQRALNKLGIEPQLVEDGINGKRTMAAISAFQQQNGLHDTGLPDAATIAALARQSVHPVPATPTTPALPTPAPIALPQILQQLQALEQAILSINKGSAMAPGPLNPNDPIAVIERVTGILQKLNLPSGAAAALPANSGTASAEQLQQAMNVILAIAGRAQPVLGQVNGALGQTIGNLLNGKKAAIGIGGSLLTSLLSAAAASPQAGGLGGVVQLLATSVPGLGQFALPIFLAMTVWGVLGKFEKWNQGTAPLPKAQV